MVMHSWNWSLLKETIPVPFIIIIIIIIVLTALRVPWPSSEASAS
jgi:hypothetical protein